MKRERWKATAIKVKDWPILWAWLKAQNPRTRDYVVIGVFTPMRLEVLNSLRWDRYDDMQRTYLLEPDQRGNKTGERVPISLPDYVVENILRPRWKAKGEDDVWILPSPRYPAKPMRSIRNALDRLLKDTGIDVTVHDLRRTSEFLIERDPSRPDPEAPRFSDEEIEEWLEDPSKYDPWYWQHEKKT